MIYEDSIEIPHMRLAGHNGRILIVDDDYDVIRVLEEYLALRDYTVTCCTTGMQARGEMEKYDFDVLLLDLLLPDITGVDLLKMALKRDPHVIGIIITGNGTVQAAVDAMKSGAFDFLMKPIAFELLLPILDRAMQVRRIRQSEEKYRALVDELSDRVRDLQNAQAIFASKELEIFELKEEINELKRSLKRYQDMYANYFYNGGNFEP